MVTVKELKLLCKKAGIKGCYKLRKRELEALLEIGLKNTSREVLYDRRIDDIMFIAGDLRENAYVDLDDESVSYEKVSDEVWNSVALISDQNASTKLYLLTPSIDIKGNIVDVLESMDIKSTIGELFDKYNQSVLESLSILGLTREGLYSEGVSFTKCEFDESGICVTFKNNRF